MNKDPTERQETNKQTNKQVKEVNSTVQDLKIEIEAIKKHAQTGNSGKENFRN